MHNIQEQIKAQAYCVNGICIGELEYLCYVDCVVRSMSHVIYCACSDL